MRIAMIGTRGVPARYGGFETAVEEIGSRLAARGHGVTVYCRNPGQRIAHYKGMGLVNLPALRLKAAETLSHSLLSAAHAVIAARPDVAFVFNPSNAPVIPLLQAAGIPVAVNMDGLESQRAKWAGAAARYIRWAEMRAMTSADSVIADSRVIADEVARRSGRRAVYTPYGAGPGRPDRTRLAELDLESQAYVLVVARLEPENQVDRIVASYAPVETNLPLVVVGDSPYSHDYTRRVRELAAADPRVRLVGAIHDQELLDTLYSEALLYIHGHSVGGTNPSLLRAVRVAPVLAFDTPFAREVAGYAAAGYWRDEHSLSKAISHVLASPRVPPLTDLFDARFDWDQVASDYEALALSLAPRGALPNRNDQVSVFPGPMSDPGSTVRPIGTPLSRGAA